MKIAFADPSGQAYTPQTPYDRALGGTQSAAAYLSAALAARGHTVSLFTEGPSGGRVRGVDCPGRPAGVSVAQMNAHDVVVVLTQPVGAWLRENGLTVPLVLWQHMHAGSEPLKAFARPEQRDAFTAAAFVSEHQRASFKARFGLDGAVLRNAVSPASLSRPARAETFLDGDGGFDLIYASTPARGLDTLLISFPTIRAALPEARLRIFSDLGIYQQHASRDDYGVYYALAKALPGVEFVGSVSQTDLAEAMRSADIFAYPTTFIETSCIVLMEAAHAGCMIAAPDVGALKETAEGFGRFFPLPAGRAGLAGDMARAVIDSVEQARRDPDAFRRQRERQIATFRDGHSWAQRAIEWETWLGGLADA